MVPNFIFVSFPRTECLHDSKLQVNAPFNNPCVANTCKECKPTCPSLEFHNLKESPSKHSEAAKFSVNALFFKYYKLLHRMPFRTTNEPLNILRMPSLKVLSSLCLQSSNPNHILLQLMYIPHIFQLFQHFI